MIPLHLAVYQRPAPLLVSMDLVVPAGASARIKVRPTPPAKVFGLAPAMANKLSPLVIPRALVGIEQPAVPSAACQESNLPLRHIIRC